MESFQLKCVESLAKYKDYERGAKEVGISLAEMAAQIARLETTYGVRLFAQQGAEIRITEAGKEFLSFAQKMRVEKEVLRVKMERFTNAEDGLIRIGILSGMQSLGFAYLLASFRERHPNADFDIHEASNLELIDMAERGTIDLAVAINPPNRENLVLQKLYDDELVLITPLSHRLAQNKEVTLRELEGETFLFSDSDTMYEDFCRVLEQNTPDMHVNFFLTHGTGLLNNIGLIACGFGVTVLTKNITEAFTYFDFAKIKLAPKIPRTFHFVSTREALEKRYVKTFVEEISMQYDA